MSVLNKSKKIKSNKQKTRIKTYIIISIDIKLIDRLFMIIP